MILDKRFLENALRIVIILIVSAVSCNPDNNNHLMNEEDDSFTFQAIEKEGGVLRYKNGQEVSLFGTNYYPMSWYQFLNMNSTGIDFREMIIKDVQEMKKMGVQVVRIHVFEREISDGEGNLVENQHLEIFDMLVDELNKNGIYLYLTSLCWWNSPVQLESSFAGKFTKMGMIFQKEAVEASEKFVSALLSHKNKYNNRALKDEPALAVIEIINEPWYFTFEATQNKNNDSEYHKGNETPVAIYDRDYAAWQDLWHVYLLSNNITNPNIVHYNQFQKGVVQQYLDRMYDVIRNVGANQPIVAALFETAQNPGVLEAIVASKTEVVADGWYPGGFKLNEYDDTLFEEAVDYDLPLSLKNKARVVYEFDISGTFNNVGMYPAMARRYRSMGAQIACQFQYDSSITSPCNSDWGTHYLNYSYTPAKSVSFQIAALAFNSIPLGTKYNQRSDRQVFGRFAVSYQPYQAMYISPDTAMYAHEIKEWMPFVLPDTPRLIIGRGNSNLIEYDGTGFYKLERKENGSIEVYISPNIEHDSINEDFFTGNYMGRIISRLDVKSSNSMKIKYLNWDSIKICKTDGTELTVNGVEIEVVPGEKYILSNQ